jgi:hypothetical protein
MPGIINSPLSDSSVGAVASMKRAHDADSVPTYGAPHPKKQKVVHHLRHKQPVQHIADPVSAEIGDFGDSKEFFHSQLRRSIAIQCKAQGFDTATPEALEEFTGLVDSCTASPLRDLRNHAGEVRNPQLIKHRHDQIPSTSTEVHEQRAPHRDGSPRLGICPRILWPARFGNSRTTSRHGRRPPIITTTTF